MARPGVKDPPPIFETRKTSAFSTNAQSRFASFNFDCDLVVYCETSNDVQFQKKTLEICPLHLALPNLIAFVSLTINKFTPDILLALAPAFINLS